MGSNLKFESKENLQEKESRSPHHFPFLHLVQVVLERAEWYRVAQPFQYMDYQF